MDKCYQNHHILAAFSIEKVHTAFQSFKLLQPVSDWRAIFIRPCMNSKRLVPCQQIKLGLLRLAKSVLLVFEDSFEFCPLIIKLKEEAFLGTTFKQGDVDGRALIGKASSKLAQLSMIKYALWLMSCLIQGGFHFK
jgi:hypothetical protein